MAPNFGLISKSDRKKVPLDSIKIEASVSGFTAHVTSTLQYTNKEDNPIEAIYIFPLDEQAALCGFEVTIDGRTIVAEVHEKQEAKDIYDDAISSGHGAYMLGESDESSDIFRISVGNLPPKKSATVELKFVTELVVEKEGRVVFVLPNVLRPRYSPAGTGPSLSSQVSSVPSVQSPYSFDFEMKVKTSSAIIDINSPSGSLNVKINANDKNKASVSLAGEHKGDRDIEVHIVTAEPFKPHAVVEDGVVKPGNQSESDFMAKPVVMLNFFPEFPSGPLMVGEFIFIIDRSGSMTGDRIRSASETLLLFLKSLPNASGCHFNVIGFGSTYQNLFKKSEVYNDKSLEKACKHAENMDADLGGTEILEPLKWVFSQPVIKGAPRQVFLLTDGAVRNTQQVIRLVQKNTSTARCFAFGIGEGASTALIKGVARAGRGTAVFVTSKDRLQAKVVKTLKRALEPVLSEVQIVWDLPEGWSAKQTPATPPPVFSGDRLITYAVLDRTKEAEKVLRASVTLQATLAVQSTKTNVEHSLTFHMEPGSTASPLIIHRLTAKSLIQELEDSDEAAAVSVSQSANVISKHTSFVAVDEVTQEVISRSMTSRDIPRLRLCGGGDRESLPALDLLFHSAPGGTGRHRVTGGGPSLSVLSKGKKSAKKARTKKGRITTQKLACLLTTAGAEDEKTPIGQLSKQVSSMDVVALQRASGAWELTEKLAGACGKTLKKLRKACPKTVSIDTEHGKLLWATALALMCLAGKFAATSDEWEMVAEKGKAWLQSNLPSGVDYAALAQDATTALKIID